MVNATTVHRHTPTLLGMDGRGQFVRSVAYARDGPGGPAQTRIARMARDAVGRVAGTADSRLWPLWTDVRTHSLSGRLLATRHVDAGTVHCLPDPAGEGATRWNAGGHRLRVAVDARGRKAALFVRASGEVEHCAERFDHGAVTEADRLAAGRLVRQDDAAGRLDVLAYDMTGTVLRSTQRFLSPGAEVDWPLSEACLAADAIETARVTDALGVVGTMIDAAGHRHRYRFDMAGDFAATDCRLVGEGEPPLAIALEHDAEGHVRRETMGDLVASEFEYDPAYGRLVGQRCLRSDEPIQDIAYEYDAAGNVIGKEDRVLPVDWFVGDFDPVERYGYDSLSQLIAATGRSDGAWDPHDDLPPLALPGGNGRWASYTERYAYDRSGNLVERRHLAEGVETVLRMIVDTASNRAVPEGSGWPPVADAFDAAGNQTTIEPGQALRWDLRGRLLEVSFATMPSGQASERYVYAADGGLVRRLQANGAASGVDVLYLPGLERHGAYDIVHLGGGRCGCRVLISPGVAEVRIDIADRLHSIGLELDGDGDVVTCEGYLPYGSTSWWGGRSPADAAVRDRRHAGRRRGAAGIHHDAHRSCLPRAGRWLSPDPAGDVDGLNRYRFVGCNPVTFEDRGGLHLTPPDQYDPTEQMIADQYRMTALARGLDNPYGALAPEDAQLLRESFALATQITAHGAGVLRAGADVELDMLLAGIYRIDTRVDVDLRALHRLRHRYADSLDAMNATLRDRTVANAYRAAWFDSPTDVAALTNPRDPARTMFFHREMISYMDRTYAAYLILHEESHLSAGTLDNHYAMRFADFVSIPDADRARVHEQFRPAVTSLLGYQPVAFRPTPTERRTIDRWPTGGVSYFSATERQRRAWMHMLNADTLALVAVHAAPSVIEQANRWPRPARMFAPSQWLQPGQALPHGSVVREVRHGP